MLVLSRNALFTSCIGSITSQVIIKGQITHNVNTAKTKTLFFKNQLSKKTETVKMQLTDLTLKNLSNGSR